MPANTPGWPAELPENTTEAEYRALAEDVSRSVEIVHGHVIKCESAAPAHNRIARRLSFALESARSPSNRCLAIETAVDVVLWRSPRFTMRRPDVVVYECRDDPARKPTAQETVLVVEVASPGTAREDLLDKRAQYAAAGIALYLVVLLDATYDISEIREFHLDAAALTYRLHAVRRSVLDLEQPVRLILPISELVTA